MHPRLERLQKDFRDFKRLFTEEGVIDPSRRKALEKIAASPVVIPLAAISEIKKETTPEGDSYDKIKGYRVHEATKDAFGYVDVQMADGFVYSDDLYYLCLRIGEEGGVLDKNTGRVLGDKEWNFIYGCRDSLVNTDQPTLGDPLDGEWKPKSQLRFSVDNDNNLVVKHNGVESKIPFEKVLKAVNETAMSEQFDNYHPGEDVSWLLWRNCATLFTVGSLTAFGIKIAYSWIKAAEERELARLLEQGYFPMAEDVQDNYEGFEEDEE